MTKESILAMANKGRQTYNGLEFEVITRTDSDGDEMMKIKLYPLNDYTTPAFFGGGWVKYYSDEDCEELFPALERTAERMKEQAQIVNAPKVIYLSGDGESINIENKRKQYEKQDLRDENGDVFGFQVFSLFKGEATAPINVNINLNGKIYRPIWSFWLDSAYYAVDEQNGEGEM